MKFCYERKNVSELARELGIFSYLIYHWRKEIEKYGHGSFPGNGIIKMTSEEKGLADLKENMRTELLNTLKSDITEKEDIHS